VLFNLAEPTAGGDETEWLYYQTGVFFLPFNSLFSVFFLEGGGRKAGKNVNDEKEKRGRPFFRSLFP